MEKTGINKHHEIIIYKAAFRLWLFIFFVFVFSGYDKAGDVFAGTHTHINSVCYDVDPHVHGSTCYKEVTEVCGGTWVKSESKAYVAKYWYGATCSSCGSSVEGTGTTKKCSCGTKVKLSFVGCDIKGYVIWKCNSCGETKKGTEYECYAACERKEVSRTVKDVKADVDYEYGDEYENERHVSNVKKNILTCKKQVGEYYDASGKKASPVCGKIVTKIIPNAEIQSIKQGEELNTLVTLYMYNGDIVTGYECEAVGLDTKNVSNEYQNVTLKVSSDDYKYKYDVTENKRIETEIYTNIKVLLINNFKLSAEAGAGGEIFYTVNESKESGKINAADKIVVTVKPDTGYFVKNFVLKKGTEEIKIISDGEVTGDTDGNTERNTDGNTDENADANTDGNSDSLTVNSDKSITYEFVMPESDVNLYADFALNSVKVVFDPCGGDIDGSSDNIVKITNYGKKLGESFDFPETPDLPGYLFLGWYDETGTAYGENSVWMYEDTLFLYAGWGAKAKNTIIVKYDDEIPTPEHKNILGFEESATDFWRYSEYKGNGAGEVLTEGTILKTLKDMDFYGHWDAKKYKIHFDAGEGEISDNEKTKTVRYHTKIGDLPYPVLDGYMFCGWKISDKIDFINPEDIYLYTSDITLYAVWQGEGDEKTAVIDAGIYAINNIPGDYGAKKETEEQDTKEQDTKEQDTDGIFVNTAAGDRISFYIRGQLSNSVKLPVKIKVTPIYEIKNEENEYESVHILSTGFLRENGDVNENGKIWMFYERGPGSKDFFSVETQEKYINVNLNYVLNHLSYAVREENYESMIAYSEVNTLSGYEWFFEKKAAIRISFDLEIVDSENDVIYDNIVFRANSKLR